MCRRVSAQGGISKVMGGTKLNTPVIDGPALPRYSQAQIKDLVAYANPRSQEAAQSNCSSLRRVSGNLPQPAASPLSLRHRILRVSTTAKLAIDAPGVSARGFARSISCFQRPIGG